MAISFRTNNGLLSRLKSLVNLQRFNHILMDGGVQAQFHREMGSASVGEQDSRAYYKCIDKVVYADTSNWKRVDSRAYGISCSMISSASWIVLKVLKKAGFEAYLVGGCVRDLLLNKIPKDFDVITSADLKQIRRNFGRAEIVGKRFPICMVHVKGSIIEVSSFHTVAKKSKGEDKGHILSRFPNGCDEKDKVRWRDSMKRDFTVNSLLFDPFLNKIYDYVKAMMDIKSLKLRTVVSAQLSFKEDCARILRGIRIAARLGLSISKDTVTAIRHHSSSIKTLPTDRLMLEMNYMLSYGAGVPSISLLRRFKLLEFLLPFHAAHLDQQAKKHSSERSIMLIKLFSNLDKLVACDQPSGCSLWIGLLSFHLALVNKPQDLLVVWTFASVLYHGNWNDGVNFAREHVQNQHCFLPEISDPWDYESDRELVKKVTQFLSVLQASVDPLIEKKSLSKLMSSKFPDYPCSGLVFIPKKTGREAAQLFDLPVDGIQSRKQGRKNFKIDYYLLRKGDQQEIRFALGKVILNTLSNEIFEVAKDSVKERTHMHASAGKGNPDNTLENHLMLSNVIKDQIVDNPDKKRSRSQSTPELLVKQEKRQKGNPDNTLENHLMLSNVIKDQIVGNADTKRSRSQSTPELLVKQEKRQKVVEKIDTSQYVVSKTKQKVVGTYKLSQVKETVAKENTPKKIPAKEKQKAHGKKKSLPAKEKQKAHEKTKSKESLNKHNSINEKMKEKTSQDGSVNTKKQPNVYEKRDLAEEKIKSLQEEVSADKNYRSMQVKVKEKNEKNKDLVKEKNKNQNRPLLSSLFR